MKRITVIGGGISGVSLSTLLAQNTNHQISLLEKARRLGGRASSLPLACSTSVAIGVQTFELDQYIFESQAYDLVPRQYLKPHKNDRNSSHTYGLQSNIWSKVAQSFEKHKQVNLMLSHHDDAYWFILYLDLVTTPSDLEPTGNDEITVLQNSRHLLDF